MALLLGNIWSPEIDQYSLGVTLHTVQLQDQENFTISQPEPPQNCLQSSGVRQFGLKASLCICTKLLTEERHKS